MAYDAFSCGDADRTVWVRAASAAAAAVLYAAWIWDLQDDEHVLPDQWVFWVEDDAYHIVRYPYDTYGIRKGLPDA